MHPQGCGDGVGDIRLNSPISCSSIAERHYLAEQDVTTLASPWHTDADPGRPIEVVTDMGKSRRLGFTRYQPTDDVFFDLFALLRSERPIP